MMTTSKPVEDLPSPGGGSMNDQQLADHLRELRTNRAARLNGSRPPPPSRVASSRQRPSTSAGETILPSTSPSPSPSDEPGQTSMIDYRAHGRAKSMDTGGRINFAGRPLFPAPTAVASLPLIPDGDESGDVSPKSMRTRRRSAETHEAYSLRKAMENVDLDEETRIHSAAQDEAAELVHKHLTGAQDSPSSAYTNPDVTSEQPKRDYRAHLRTRSALPWISPTQSSPRTTPTRPGPSSTTEWRPASSSSVLNRVNARPNLTTTIPEQEDPFVKSSPSPRSSKGKTYEKLAGAVASDVAQSRRRASSDATKRKPSEGLKAAFPSPGEKIFEEQDESLEEAREAEAGKAAEKAQVQADETPRHVRRNPFARVRQAQEKFEKKESPSGYSVKKAEEDDPSPKPSPRPLSRPSPISSPSSRNRFDRIEIHRNPPSQTRKAGYTVNDSAPPTPPATAEEFSEAEASPVMKDGIEIRGDDIRAATAMRRKDRSSNLIQPTAVSDSPGRPIVSFQAGWKPKEIEMKEERGKPVPLPESSSDRYRPYSPTTSQGRSTPTFQVQTSTSVKPPIPHIAIPDSPTTPLELPVRSQTPAAERPRAIPTIVMPDDPGVPSIVFPGEPEVPSISLQNDTSKPPVPVINEPSSTSEYDRPNALPGTRPLPMPTRSSPARVGPSRPLPTTSKTSPFPTIAHPHYTPSVRRTTALCAHCALPIAGRVLSAAGERFHPGCFKCHECSINLECVAFYPEPEVKRLERLSRIQQRQQGRDIQMPEDVTEEDITRLEEQDGDEGFRFFCHLDYHEFFSPRCKSCKTPIEGEVVVACGSEWHVGHFFCAQCGDPFDSSTPFVEKEGYAWCVGCHTNRYSAKCKRCRKPVTNLVVKALGAEWHDECFVCIECNGQFEDGRYFLRGPEQNPVCVRCEDRRLKA